MADKVLFILRSKYLKTPIRYDGLSRIEDLEYPEEALREAILNAIVHKDYTGTTIQLSVYDDKLILWNEGKLPEDLNIKQLKGKHPSRPRNKNIAEIFFRAGYIEVWGRGIAKINSSLTTAGLPKLDLAEFAGGLQLTFINKKIDEPKNEPKNAQENRLKLILKAINLDKHISIPELAIQINASKITVKRDIQQLKEQSIIKRVGPLKGGYWEINKG